MLLVVLLTRNLEAQASVVSHRHHPVAHFFWHHPAPHLSDNYALDHRIYQNVGGTGGRGAVSGFDPNV